MAPAAFAPFIGFFEYIFQFFPRRLVLCLGDAVVFSTAGRRQNVYEARGPWKGWYYPYWTSIERLVVSSHPATTEGDFETTDGDQFTVSLFCQWRACDPVRSVMVNDEDETVPAIALSMFCMKARGMDSASYRDMIRSEDRIEDLMDEINRNISERGLEICELGIPSSAEVTGSLYKHYGGMAPVTAE